MRAPNPSAFRILVPAATAFAATFMPWGTVPMAKTNLPSDFPDFLRQGTFTATAYDSTLTLRSVTLPNWTPALIAGAMALAALFGAIRSLWGWAGVAVGMAYVLTVARWFALSGGTIGLGPIVTLVTFLALGAALWRPRKGFVPNLAPMGSALG